MLIDASGVSSEGLKRPDLSSFAWSEIGGLPRGLHFHPVFAVGWIEGRNIPDNRLNDDIYIAGAGLRLVHWWHGVFASFQVAVAGGRAVAISSGGQLVSSLGWSGEHWMVMLRHISNGDIFGGRNCGETMLLAGVRF